MFGKKKTPVVAPAEGGAEARAKARRKEGDASAEGRQAAHRLRRDAVESVKRTAERLKPYFEVFIADIADAAKDWDELTESEIYGIFACRLLSVLEYKLKKVQER